MISYTLSFSFLFPVESCSSSCLSWSHPLLGCCCRWLRWLAHIVVYPATAPVPALAAVLVCGFVCLDNLLMNAFAYQFLSPAPADPTEIAFTFATVLWICGKRPALSTLYSLHTRFDYCILLLIDGKTTSFLYASTTSVAILISFSQPNHGRS